MPSSYGFSEADLDRKIFIDGVLGLEFATIREMLDILRRTYCAHHRIRVHAHLRSGAEGLDPGAHRRPEQGDRQLEPRRQARDPEQAGRGEGL